MLKKYKWTMISTSIILIIPVIFGLVMWNSLPDMIPTHFDAANNVNGWSSKGTAVLGIPLFMLAIQWLVFVVTASDPRRQNISPRIQCLILWITPAVSIIEAIVIYGTALGIDIDITLFVNILLGIIFIVLGNYMHKVKQNYSIGVKISWTLNSEENWNRTNRMSSWLLIICGIAFIANAFLKTAYIPAIVIVLFLVVPFAYSYYLYRKGV